MRFKGLLVAILLAGFATSARADIVYSLKSEFSDYSAASGATVSVNLYLYETLSKGSTSIIGTSGEESGLFDASFGIGKVGGTATITALLASAQFASANTKAQVQVGGNNAALLELVKNGDPIPKALPESASVNKILLGSLNIQVGT